MKKTFIVFVMIVAMAFGLIGCHNDSQPKELESVDGSSFLIVEYGVNYDIVYHKETKVMYIVSDGEYNRGNFTVMVNADGTPMVYKEDQGSILLPFSMSGSRSPTKIIAYPGEEIQGKISRNFMKILQPEIKICLLFYFAHVIMNSSKEIRER